MDEASVLIATLQSKLRELDHKVLLYRREMAAEFSKHSDSVLRDVAPDVAATVTTAVAEGMDAYPSLVEPVAEKGEAVEGMAAEGPAESEAAEGSAEGERQGPASQIALEVGKLKEQGKLAPPQPIAVDRTTDEDIPRSPHAREKEFLGVFTQGYLPLLESRDKDERRSNTEALPIAEIKDKDTEMDKKAEQTAANLSASYSPPPRKPEPRRRDTDDSGTMSDPENPVRRSALRRRSSSGKVSGLRRVRFEFAGQEFPTTSSPSLTDTSLLPSALDATSTSSYTGDEEQSEVEQVEDVDEEPEPKRISSSQALRMLSRGPIEDDGTTWDEVRAPADGSASVSVEDVNAMGSDDEEDFISMAPRKSSSSSQSPIEVSPIDIPATTSTPPHVPELHKEESEVSVEEAAEEEDILSEMTPLAPMHSTRGVVMNNTGSPSIPIGMHGNPNILNTPTSTTATQSQTPKPTPTPTPSTVPTKPKPKQHRIFDLPSSDSEDDFFTFDDAPPSTRPPRPARVPSPDPSSSSSSTSSSTAVSPERPVPAALSTYATSPARDIVLPKHKRANTDPYSGPAGSVGGNGAGNGAGAGAGNGAKGPYTPTTPTSLRNISSSSYHPFSLPIVSPAVHEAARRMGEVSSFVGSLRDGMALAEGMSVGMGEGGGGGGGRPRSFSERFAAEEWAAGRGRE